MKVILIVLDSVGAGEAPDADKYGDAGSATLPHIAGAVGGVKLPVLEKLGLGNITGQIPNGIPIKGVKATTHPLASFGAMCPMSEGKDTVTGHWEIAGLEIRPGFHLFPPGPPSFPPELLKTLAKKTKRKIIGDKAASGTAIMNELGEEQMKTGAWIAYTSADSVFQIAANIDVIPLKELYRACEIARELCDPLKVGRVIARPFRGKPGTFQRTEDRRDYAFKPEEPTVLERLIKAKTPVYGVGKIEDIFAHRGITESFHTGNTGDSQKEVSRLTREKEHGLIFANFIDFDMLYGHRRDAIGYAQALQQTDRWLKEYIPLLTEKDLLIITADHGNDPTFKGSDHTREYVPLIVYQPNRPAKNLCIRKGYYDIAQSIARYFGLPALPRGASFL